MRWNLNLPERWAQRFRLALNAILALNSLMLAVFSVWFTAIFLVRLGQYLVRTWFGHRW